MQVLHQLAKFEDPNLLFGWDTMDDAGAYAINGARAIVQTIDVLTPIANDPYIFGQIVAANSLSDLYAMGVKPITALSFISFPVGVVDNKVIQQILAGVADKVKESGAVILGGHTIKDTEIKCGLAVTGIAEPKKIVKNSNAQIGDKLILTKPLGIGIITTALKADLAPAQAEEKANYHMCQLNRIAMEKMLEIGINSATDIAGFGLLGHALEMAQVSKVNFRIFADKVPIIEEAFALAKESLFPEGSVKNYEYIRQNVCFTHQINQELKMLLCDAQTSGGLFISARADKLQELVETLKKAGVECATIIGDVLEGEGQIFVSL